MIGQVISHYRILDKLGEGGMGVVYLAEDTTLRRQVAVKMLRASLGQQRHRARFLREARAVSMLTHRNIAAVYDFGETPDGHPFIVMELATGETLDTLIGQGGLKLAASVAIISQTAEALSEAHRREIIHRDIKPSNVAVSGRGEVKVLDFGLAKHLAGDASDERRAAHPLAMTQTSESLRVGTPLYLSPEQALGLPLDTRSDIFSLGSLLYECVAGRPAFGAATEAEICAKVVREDPPPPSHFNRAAPPELDRITLKALAKKPQDRYRTAEELIADLRALRPALADSDGEVVPRKRSRSGGQVPRHASALVPRYVVTGYEILRRPRVLTAVFLTTLTAGQVQPHLSLSDAKRILVALIPKVEQVRIEALVLSSAKARNRANEAWVGAQQLLESELGLDRLSSQKLVGYRARFNELETSRRVDAEHFYPEFESLKAKAPKKVRFVKLRQDLVYCQRGKQPIYARSGLRVINSKHVQVNRLSIDDCRTAIPSSFPGSNIRNGDLLLNGTGVGTIGRAAPYLEDADAIPDNHVTVIRTRTLDPVYLSVFLNSQIGQAQVRKHQRGSSGQLELYPRDIARFEVWEAPESVQNEIRQLIVEAYGASSESRLLLEEAKAHVEKLIRQALTP